jgi:uncharacterized protein YbjT (DUF2867 family)
MKPFILVTGATGYIGGRLVPPQAEEADFAHLIADLVERRQKLFGDFLPSPPIVPDMQDVIDLRRHGGWIGRSARRKRA